MKPAASAIRHLCAMPRHPHCRLTLLLCAGLVIGVGFITTNAGGLNAQPKSNANANANSNTAKGNDPKAQPAEQKPTTVRGWMFRAEVCEQALKLAEAKTAREEAAKLIEERLTKCAGWLKKVTERLAAPDLSPEEKAVATTWKRFIELELTKAQNEKECNAAWLAELAKDKSSIFKHVDDDRLLVWDKAEGLSKCVTTLRGLEAKGQWTEAHAARREWLMTAKANLRFMLRKLEIMEADAKSWDKSATEQETKARQKPTAEQREEAMKAAKQTRGFATVMAAKAVFYKQIVAETTALTKRIEAIVAAEQDPALNAAEALFWEHAATFAATYDLPADILAPEKCKTNAAIAKGRADYYAQREKK